MDFRTSYSSTNLENYELDVREICIIPGNPGVKEYYSEYVRQLIADLRSKSTEPFQVTSLSHKGHHLNNGKYPIHGVQDQVEFHRSFIQERVQSRKSTTLIGHSIGCYIILELLRDEVICSKVDKAILLFPTIERMRESPAGRRLTPFLNWFPRFIILFLLYILSFLPYSMRRKVAAMCVTTYRKGAVPDHVLDATTAITMRPSVMRQVLYMAHTEMQTVREPNLEMFEMHKSKILAYYGHSDHWCPEDYYEEMKGRFPDAQIYKGSMEYRHDFVVESSKEMALITSQWIADLWT